jgi:hypothetical protein
MKIRVDLWGAGHAGDMRHPSHIIAELGIKYGRWEGIPMADSIVLHDVVPESVPSVLPDYVKVYSDT